MDDRAIVKLYWDRDESAIPITSRKYGKYCYSIADNILGNKEDAEECVNDTYFNAWNAMPPHKPERLATFLGKIIRNLSLDRWKYNTADKRGGNEFTMVLDEISELVSGIEDTEKIVEVKELLSNIEQFLDSLPESNRDIFVCRYWYADSLFDISKQFGLSENNVSVILNRIRKKLRNYLTSKGYEL